MVAVTVQRCGMISDDRWLRHTAGAGSRWVLQSSDHLHGLLPDNRFRQAPFPGVEIDSNYDSSASCCSEGSL